MSDLRVILTETGEIQFGLGPSPRSVSGVQALVQQVIIELLSDFDTNLGRGAGLETLITRSAPDEKEATKSAIITAISSAKAHIISNQQTSGQIVPSERLQDLKPLEVSSLDGLTWTIRLQVTNFNDDTVTTAVTL